MDGDTQVGSPAPPYLTATSLGYSTVEAVPMTVYYRNTAGPGGEPKRRPSLDYLHEGVGKRPAQVTMRAVVHYSTIANDDVIVDTN